MREINVVQLDRSLFISISIYFWFIMNSGPTKLSPKNPEPTSINDILKLSYMIVSTCLTLEKS